MDTLPSRSIVDRSTASRALEASTASGVFTFDLSHFESTIFFRLRGFGLSPFSEALITILVGVSESHVGWWTRPHDNAEPVPQDRVLAEWAMAVLLEKFVAVKVFPCRFTSAHEEEVVTP